MNQHKNISIELAKQLLDNDECVVLDARDERSHERYGLANIVTALLHAGADIHSTNDDGNNALWLACLSGDARIIDSLLESGIDINNQNVTEATTLMYAASAGKAGIVRRLLDAGADPHLMTQDDYTALDMAASPATYKLLRRFRPNTSNTGAA